MGGFWLIRIPIPVLWLLFWEASVYMWVHVGQAVCICLSACFVCFFSFGDVGLCLE